MTRTLRILKSLGSRGEPGDEVRVECDAEGTPLDQYWRRRVRDSVRDGCVEFVEPVKRASKRRRASADAERSLEE